MIVGERTYWTWMRHWHHLIHRLLLWIRIGTWSLLEEEWVVVCAYSSIWPSRCKRLRELRAAKLVNIWNEMSLLNRGLWTLLHSEGIVCLAGSGHHTGKSVGVIVALRCIWGLKIRRFGYESWCDADWSILIAYIKHFVETFCNFIFRIQFLFEGKQASRGQLAITSCCVLICVVSCDIQWAGKLAEASPESVVHNILCNYFHI